MSWGKREGKRYHDRIYFCTEKKDIVHIIKNI